MSDIVEEENTHGIGVPEGVGKIYDLLQVKEIILTILVSLDKFMRCFAAVLLLVRT